MAIYYLDNDDEITSAAARIRDSSDSRIALVLSGGSRVATSRINFRLLAREARHRNKRLAIIAADASVQSIVRSAELPVYASVGDYEQAEAAIAGSLAGGSSGSVSDALDELALTVGPGVANGRTGRTGVTRVPGGPSSANPTLARPHVPRLLAIGIAVLVVAAVATAGIFLFPSATVVLTLRAVPVGPMTVSVNVDPSVAAANDQAGTVPGLTKAFPVEASGTYDATGQNVVDTPATGTVTFTSINTVSSVPVIAGTQVGTAGGIEFATTATVNVPRATVSGDKITRGAVDAPVQAMTKGLAGNVGAGTIVKEQADLAAFQVSVTNKAATTGGTHTVTPKIQQSDIAAAEADLQAQLESSFQAALKSPGAVPSGSNLFIESAQLGVAICSPDPQGLLNQEGTSFQLDCKGTGVATTANTASVTDLARRRLSASVKTGYSLVGSSVTANVGTAVAQGSSLVVPVAIGGLQVPNVDVDKLRTAVTGKSLDDARSYLSQYGQVDISVTPGWASTMPGFDFRIDIQVVVPPVHPSGSPQPSGSQRAAAEDNGVPSAAGGIGTAPPAASPPATSTAGASPTPGPTDTPSPPPSPTASTSASASPVPSASATKA